LAVVYRTRDFQEFYLKDSALISRKGSLPNLSSEELGYKIVLTVNGIPSESQIWLWRVAGGRSRILCDWGRHGLDNLPFAIGDLSIGKDY
jgi:hypothetical protein